MALVQVYMEIPDELAARIDGGELVRTAGTVRKQSGEIVKHLQEVAPPDASEAAEVAQKALDMAKQYKYPPVGIGVAAVAAISGVVAYKLTHRQKEEANAELQKRTAEFNEAMTSYLSSVRDGNLNEEDLSRIVEQVDELKDGLDGETVQIDLDAEQLEALIGMLKPYTKRLARANGMKMAKPPKVKKAGDNGNVILLSHYLNEQQRILQSA